MEPHLDPAASPLLAAGAAPVGPLTTGLIAFGVLVLAFASLVTTHVALAYRLARVGPPWRGWLALFVPPLAPVWGFLAGLRTLPVLWILAGVVYLASLVLASRPDPGDPEPKTGEASPGAGPQHLLLHEPPHDHRSTRKQ